MNNTRDELERLIRGVDDVLEHANSAHQLLLDQLRLLDGDIPPPTDDKSPPTSRRLHDPPRREATILGEGTFGKDAVQIAFGMNNGGEFNVAVARWFSPNGTSVAGTGVIPDRLVELPRSLTTGELADIAFEGA